MTDHTADTHRIDTLAWADAATDDVVAGVLAELLPLLGGERAELWRVERALWQPFAVIARDTGGAVVGALLIAGRPRTAYRKVVDAWVADDDQAVARALLERSLELSEASEAISTKFEHHATIAPLGDGVRAALTALGFVADDTPARSVDSTDGRVSGWSHWFGRRPSTRVPYYGQTTEVTCGAVTALMALEADGAGFLSAADGAANREAEITLWRSATNMPAVEPIALAVTTAREAALRSVPFGIPIVHLSVDGPSLLEWYTGFDRELRAELQAESLRQAGEIGIVVHREWCEIDDIVAAVERGDFVFLLIDLTIMINDPTPHWVLAHDVIDGAIVISDPWVESEHGETWVDTNELPVPFATVDAMTRWGEPAYRGVVVVPRGEPGLPG